MGRKRKAIEFDEVFTAAGEKDLFSLEHENPYFAAFVRLPLAERKIIVRQVTLVCAALELDIEGALELLAKLGMFLNGCSSKISQR